MGIIYIAFTEVLVCKENPTVSALGALLTVRREVGVCPAALPPAPEPQSEWEAASARPTAPLGARGGGWSGRRCRGAGGCRPAPDPRGGPPAVCRSCLVKYLEENNTCPTCRIVIHQSHPLQYIG